MEETLIKLETAKLAKAKKFKEKTISFYSNPTEYEPDLTLYEINDNEELIIDDFNSQDNFPWVFYSAPTISQLAKWLRDNHNISVNALPNANGWKYRIDLIKNYMNMCNSGENYSSYEESLEAGLLVALQMI